jgi:hypothetical protein
VGRFVHFRLFIVLAGLRWVSDLALVMNSLPQQLLGFGNELGRHDRLYA